MSTIVTYGQLRLFVCGRDVCETTAGLLLAGPCRLFAREISELGCVVVSLRLRGAV